MNNTLSEITGPVKRARGYRIYTQNGKRILDFYQDGGKSLLGSRPKGVSLALKKEIEKGCFSSFPSSYEKRVIKAVARLAGTGSFSGALFQSVRDLMDYISAVEKRECVIREYIMFAEKSETSAAKDACFWHPFSPLSLASLLDSCRYVIPLLPFPGNFSPAVLLSKPARVATPVPVPPVLLSGLEAAANALIPFIASSPYTHWEKHLHRIEKIWKISTPYLQPLYSEEKHDFVFRTFLENGILVQPEFSMISALPAEISEGERKKFLETADKVIRGL